MAARVANTTSRIYSAVGYRRATEPPRAASTSGDRWSGSANGVDAGSRLRPDNGRRTNLAADDRNSADRGANGGGSKAHGSIDAGGANACSDCRARAYFRSDDGGRGHRRFVQAEG